MKEKIPRQPMPEQPPAERVRNFKEVPLGYSDETARLEASRCLQCKRPTCVDGCPVRIDIPGFIKAIRDGDFLESIRVIKLTNSLPAVCGRVCPQEEQCEQLCVLTKKGESVAIGKLERFAADYEREREQLEIRASAERKNGRVAVLGSGPAGLTAAGELAKLGYRVTVFEAFHSAGGVLVYGIPEFRLPKAIVQYEVDALAKLQELDEVEYAIDLKMNYGAGEWFTYAFSPVLQSFGGDLIDRETYMTAEGFLNGPEAVAAMTWLQGLFEKGYAIVSPPDDYEFENGKAALGWIGHWMATPYYEAFGDDMVILPMPDFGAGAVTGMGSWAWSISSQCDNPEAAWTYLEFALQPEEILAITNENGAVPGRSSALGLTDLFGEGGRLSIFAQQLEGGVAFPRPVTPGYPAITTAFYTAMDNIIKGADVQTELDAAVDKIDQDIADNDGYPVK